MISNILMKKCAIFYIVFAVHYEHGASYVRFLRDFARNICTTTRIISFVLDLDDQEPTKPADLDGNQGRSLASDGVH